MPDVVHDFPIVAPTARVFEAVRTPAGLDLWWTKSSTGEPVQGATYELHFGQGYDWRAVIRVYVPMKRIEYEFIEADPDWQGTRVGFDLREKDGVTRVRFSHSGWADANDHYCTSCFCWAMYLRILKRYVEHGELVPYEKRLEV
ncbi:MAG: SRPBCC domain-containing protein [Gemmatimonadales bacterium]